VLVKRSYIELFTKKESFHNRELFYFALLRLTNNRKTLITSKKRRIVKKVFIGLLAII